ncbi:non-ribosomal peptide synthetase [Maridesulfovibrio sp.]|uniref:non-ribosomal peptide synthetase n=1 Tax=Maridesulfovibrio sp. TaxID=2795000 RepID=UPI0029F47C38|nr:non-ribosomal peptide synthetase [Maridesulfovibrio sp.]
MSEPVTVPLTHAEKRIYFTQKLYPESSMWNAPVSLRLAQGDKNILKKAALLAIDNIPGLHVVFSEKDGQPVKFIDNSLGPSIELLDFREGGEKSYLEWAEQQAKVKTTMLDCLPYSVSVADIGSGIVYIYFKGHHIAIDGGGIDYFFRSILLAYEALKDGGEVRFDPVPGLDAAYKDEQDYLESQQCVEDSSYWNSKFTTYPDPMDITGKVSSASRELEFYNYLFSRKTSRELLAFCSENRVSPFRVVLAAISAVLSRTMRREDIVFGTGIANRCPEGLADSVGMYVNTCALRMQVEPGISFGELIKSASSTVRECISHGRYPYDKLAADIRERSGDVPDLMACTLVEFVGKKMPDYAESILHNYGESLVALTAFITFPRLDDLKKNKISMRLAYQKAVFEQWQVKSLAAYVEKAVLNGIRNPETPVSRLDFMPATEIDKVLNDFNDIRGDWEVETTLNECVDKTVRRFPGRRAVVHRGRSLTYAELDAHANSLARNLQEQGAGPGTVVGLLADRSIELIVAQLAILKTGAAFMPIDTSYPEERIRFMLDDISAPLVVTQSRFVDQINIEKVNVVDMDHPEAYSPDCSALETFCSPGDLCCVVYTSGSTGTPKGVLLEHRGICNIVNGVMHTQGVNEDDRIAKHASFSFDASLLEIFLGFFCGGEVHIIPDEIRLSLSSLNEYYRANGITWTFLTTQLGEQFMNFVEDSSLRVLNVGGEKLRTFNPGNSSVRNGYGPTECSIYTTHHEVSEWAENIPIGRPFPNYSVYILDKYDNPQPPGYGGELCIYGPGVARGYHKRPEKTSECFVPCPFKPGETMYRSGDLASWTPEGEILHLGRIDRQVKLRGFRIELGEIENAILAVDGICDAAVVDYKDSRGHVYLCGYFCGSVEVDSVLEKLEDKLPEFMVPSYMIKLDCLPLNPNDKVDRKQLPEPDITEKSAEEYVAPGTELEQALADIWGEALDRAKVSAKADFFKSGGDSLKAVALQVIISKKLKRDVELSAIFEHPSPRLMAAMLENTEGGVNEKIQPAPTMEYYPATISQQQLFLLNRMKGIGTAYNMPFCIRLEGPLDSKKLSTALLTMLERHESLRSAFEIIGGRCVQRVFDKVYLKLDFVNTSSDDPAQFGAGFIRPFDLSAPPLMRAKLVSYDSELHWLLLDFHHIAFDGVSTGVFLEELFALYQGAKLEPLPFQHKDFAFWEAERREENEARHKKFWTELFETVPEAELPTDLPRPSHQDFAGESYRHFLEFRLSDKLRALAKEHGATLHHVFMSAIGILLGRWSGSEDVCLGTSMSGRDRAGTNGLVGMFVRTLPARIRPQGELPFSGLLAETRKQILSIHEHAEYPISSLYEHLGVNRGPGRHPLFDVNFVSRNTGASNHYKLNGVSADVGMLELNTAKFDISIALGDDGDNLVLDVDYRSSLYRNETIARMIGHLCRILDVVGDEPETMLKDIDILLPEERDSLLNDFNPAATEPPRWPTVCHAIAQHAAEKPDHIAVHAEDGTLTYAELDRLSSRAARAIAQNGGGKDKIIAVVAARSIWSVAGMLAALKSGSAYVGLDTAYPPDRVQFILEDTAAPCVLGTKEQLAGIEHGCTAIAMDGPLPEDDSDPGLAAGGDALAYCIFTSGSTGKPKGVLIEHHSMVNFIDWYATHHCMDSNSGCAAFAAFSFDVSVVQVFAPLVSGSTLHVIPEDLRRSPTDLDAYFNEHKISHAHFPTQFAEQYMRICDMDSLRYLIVGGDRLRSYRLGNFRLTNEYGPSETTMACLSYDVPKIMSKPPIGNPVANTRIYILDERDRLCPIGVPGEICVSGSGVGRGYLNRKELTDKHFTSDPFVPGRRMFRTGDKGCWLPDGTVDFIGRMDFQVKIRGYRIEPGEIESCLRKFDSVQDCVVVPLDEPGGNKVLAAYLCAAQELDSSEIRSMLKRELPEYMVPAHVVQLEKFPLNRNGKVDRTKLPRPEVAGPSTGPFEPRNHKEERIAKAWEKVLGHRGFGLYDSFFDIGGDSLSAIGLLAELSDSYDISASDLFAHTSIADQAANFRDAEVGRSARLLRLKELAKAPAEDEFINDQIAAYAAACELDRELDTETVREPEHLLLTGATGTLGIYLLRELLQSTKAKVTAIVRAVDDHAAQKRLADFYLERFGSSLEDDGRERVEILAGDLGRDDFGLSAQSFERLAGDVDAILHSAALTSHYGDWEVFETANVTSVKNLVAFARRGREKAVHHISTTSIGSGDVEGRNRILFTEFDVDLGQKPGNLYVRSKLEAEILLEKYRAEGLAVNVYRAGNITCDSQTGVFQSNVEDNAFYQQLRCYVNLGAAPDLTDSRNMSYVDQSAQAIVAALIRPGVLGQTFHIHNPHLMSLSKALADESLGLRIERMEFDEFIEFVARHAGCVGFDTYVERLLVHLGWQDWLTNSGSTSAQVRVDRSAELLGRCGFVWKEPRPQDLAQFVKKALEDRIADLRKTTFSILSLDALEAVASRIKPAYYPEGGLIQQENSELDQVSLIMDGMVEVYRHSALGWVGTLRVDSSGACFGEGGVLDGGKSGNSVEAIDPSFVFHFSIEDIRKLVMDYPQLGLVLLKLSSLKRERAERLFISM